MWGNQPVHFMMGGIVLGSNTSKLVVDLVQALPGKCSPFWPLNGNWSMVTCQPAQLLDPHMLLVLIVQVHHIF